MKAQVRILVIEDEPAMRGFLSDVLRGEGYLVDEAADGDDGLAKAGQREYALVVTDLKMPGRSGLDLVLALRAMVDPPEVVVLTAYGTVATAVEAMKAGAVDFMEKPVSGPDQVRVVARVALDRRRLLTENERLRGAASPPSPDLVADDPAMKAVLARIARVALTDATVLLLGESGVGKEVVARELHGLRFGARSPFVAINCAAVPESLLESELFGHERGAFTGASERKIGLFEVASDGTLLLDEVGEMPPGLQAKLLRVLECREFKRVGGVRSINTSARFVAATNQDLGGAVASGRFRRDLFYRLNVIAVTIPPLRERPGDIPRLAESFLARARLRCGRAEMVLTGAAHRALRAYDWPGNARELRNVMERACILAEGPGIEPIDLGLPVTGNTITNGDGGLLAEMEREAIFRVMREVGGNRRQAAQRLGISLRTLQYRLKEYGFRDE